MKMAKIIIPITLIAGIAVYATVHGSNGATSPKDQFASCANSSGWTITTPSPQNQFFIYCGSSRQEAHISCDMSWYYLPLPYGTLSGTLYLYAKSVKYQQNQWELTNNKMQITSTTKTDVVKTYCADAYKKATWKISPSHT